MSKKVPVYTHHYSGDNSQDFWNRVGRIYNEADHSTLYELGVALQNLEEQVVSFLKRAEITEADRQAAIRKKKAKGRKK